MNFTDAAWPVHLVEHITFVNPQRQLGLPSATALVVASMIGTGVFTTSEFLLADLRSPRMVLAAWAPSITACWPDEFQSREGNIFSSHALCIRRPVSRI